MEGCFKRMEAELQMTKMQKDFLVEQTLLLNETIKRLSKRETGRAQESSNEFHFVLEAQAQTIEELTGQISKLSSFLQSSQRSPLESPIEPQSERTPNSLKDFIKHQSEKDQNSPTIPSEFNQLLISSCQETPITSAIPVFFEPRNAAVTGQVLDFEMKSDKKQVSSLRENEKCFGVPFANTGKVIQKTENSVQTLPEAIKQSPGSSRKSTESVRKTQNIIFDDQDSFLSQRNSCPSVQFVHETGEKGTKASLIRIQEQTPARNQGSSMKNLHQKAAPLKKMNLASRNSSEKSCLLVEVIPSSDLHRHQNSINSNSTKFPCQESLSRVEEKETKSYTYLNLLSSQEQSRVWSENSNRSSFRPRQFSRRDQKENKSSFFNKRSSVDESSSKIGAFLKNRPNLLVTPRAQALFDHLLPESKNSKAKSKRKQKQIEEMMRNCLNFDKNSCHHPQNKKISQRVF